MQDKIAEALNLLGAFCGKRDLPDLTQANLLEKYGVEQADVMVLFGGSILAGGDLLAQAMQNHVAKKYAIVGGEGHTTQTLRDTVHALFPDFITDGLPEARVFEGYLLRKYGLQPDLLECESTNCGNNITNLIALLDSRNIPRQTVILAQDASMQRRMEAGMRKFAPETTIISFATYRATVIAENDQLAFAESIPGMWTPDRYASLLLGEIPRLTDDINGYGPNGKNFIAHVAIPEEITSAFQFLANLNPNLVRTANPKYATK